MRWYVTFPGEVSEQISVHPKFGSSDRSRKIAVQIGEPLSLRVLLI